MTWHLHLMAGIKRLSDSCRMFCRSWMTAWWWSCTVCSGCGHCCNQCFNCCQVITQGHPRQGRPETVPIVGQWCNHNLKVLSWHSKLSYWCPHRHSFQHPNSLKPLTLWHARHFSRSFLLNKTSGKSKTDCQWTLSTQFLQSPCEFCKAASTINNLTPSDPKEQRTMILHFGKIWQNLQLFITLSWYNPMWLTELKAPSNKLLYVTYIH